MKNLWLNKLKIGKKVRYIGFSATLVGKYGTLIEVQEFFSDVMFDIVPNMTLLMSVQNYDLECV